METLRVETDTKKVSIQGKITVLEDKCRLKDTEVKLLEDELMVKKLSAREQDAEVIVFNLDVAGGKVKVLL